MSSLQKLRFHHMLRVYLLCHCGWKNLELACLRNSMAHNPSFEVLWIRSAWSLFSNLTTICWTSWVSFVRTLLTWQALSWFARCLRSIYRFTPISKLFCRVRSFFGHVWRGFWRTWQGMGNNNKIRALRQGSRAVSVYASYFRQLVSDINWTMKSCGVSTIGAYEMTSRIFCCLRRILKHLMKQSLRPWHAIIVCSNVTKINGPWLHRNICPTHSLYQIQKPITCTLMRCDLNPLHCRRRSIATKKGYVFTAENQTIKLTVALKKHRRTLQTRSTSMKNGSEGRRMTLRCLFGCFQGRCMQNYSCPKTINLEQNRRGGESLLVVWILAMVV